MSCLDRGPLSDAHVMFETNITIIGNLLTAPEWRRTTNSGRLVASFKVAAGTRRLERSTGQWVDGNGLRVRVTCWRDLAGGVASSLMVGDPVIVYGQIFTRDWVDNEGTKRTLYEMEALAVGHNLARGRSRFARNKPVSNSEVEPDPAEPVRLGGEPTEPAPEQPIGLAADDPLSTLDDAGFGYGFGYDDPVPAQGEDPIATLRENGFEPLAGFEDDLAATSVEPDGDGDGESADETEDDDLDDLDDVDDVDDRGGSGKPGGKGARSRRSLVRV